MKCEHRIIIKGKYKCEDCGKLISPATLINSQKQFAKKQGALKNLTELNKFVRSIEKQIVNNTKLLGMVKIYKLVETGKIVKEINRLKELEEGVEK